MAGRPCKICASAANIKLAAEMIAAGAPDQAIADAIGTVSRVSVHRHRTNHVVRPAKAIAAAAAKGQDVRVARENLVTSAENGDAAAQFLGLAEITKDLRETQQRLQRVAAMAEGHGQPNAVAALAGQELRAAEVRAKLGSVGAYAPPKTVPTAQPVFSLTMAFADSTQVLGVAAVTGGAVDPTTGGPVIDMLPDDPEEPGEDDELLDEDV
jgi:hypothetical protein